MTRTKLAELIAAAAHDCDDVDCPCDPEATIYVDASANGVITRVEGPPEIIAAVVQAELDQRDTEIKRLHTLIPECNGICVTGADIGVGGSGIAYPHPDCPLHGDPDAAAYQCAAEAKARANGLLHHMATVARHIEDSEYGDADKAARQALGIAPGVDLPGPES